MVRRRHLHPPPPTPEVADHPDPAWHGLMLTREDIGYGPARPYEVGDDPDQITPRERRRARRPTSRTFARGGLGPFHHRLQRRERPDHWIRAEIEEVLFYDTWIDADRITVEVSNGTATLIGTLESEMQLERVLEDLSHVPGLRRIRNRLEIEA